MAKAELGLETERLLEPGDWGLNYPADYLYERFADYRHRGVYPDGTLARDKQSKALTDDFKVMQYELSRLIGQLRHKGK